MQSPLQMNKTHDKPQLYTSLTYTYSNAASKHDLYTHLICLPYCDLQHRLANAKQCLEHERSSDFRAARIGPSSLFLFLFRSVAAFTRYSTEPNERNRHCPLFACNASNSFSLPIFMAQLLPRKWFEINRNLIVYKYPLSRAISHK